MRKVLLCILLAACSKSTPPVIGTPEDVALYAAQLSKATGIPMHTEKNGIYLDAPTTCSLGLIKQITTSHENVVALNAHGVTWIACPGGNPLVSGPWMESR